MNRIDDLLFADDPLIHRLRGLRPQVPEPSLAPEAAANQAILQSILDTPDRAEAGLHDRLVKARPREPAHGRSIRGSRPGRRWPRRVVVRAAVGAAAAVSAIGFVVASPFGGTEPSAAALVRSAVSASRTALDSGRASVTVTIPGDEENYDYRFAGDDVAVDIVLGSESRPYPAARRIVDGELYFRVGDEASGQWFHATGEGPSRSGWTGDPRSLLASLTPTAGFEVVGEETEDGVAVTHLRATTPENVDYSELNLGEATPPGDLTALDVWVDEDAIVRRIDVETTLEYPIDGFTAPAPKEFPAQAPAVEWDGHGKLQSTTQVTTASVRFRDIGEPNTVEAPANAVDVTPEDLAHPPPPSTP